MTPSISRSAIDRSDNVSGAATSIVTFGKPLPPTCLWSIRETVMAKAFHSRGCCFFGLSAMRSLFSSYRTGILRFEMPRNSSPHVLLEESFLSLSVGVQLRIVHIKVSVDVEGHSWRSQSPIEDQSPFEDQVVPQVPAPRQRQQDVVDCLESPSFLLSWIHLRAPESSSRRSLSRKGTPRSRGIQGISGCSRTTLLRRIEIGAECARRREPKKLEEGAYSPRQRRNLN